MQHAPILAASDCVRACTDEFSPRSKLTGIVMKKGKGTERVFASRCRSRNAPGRPIVTRLTRTMGFMEVSGTPCVPGSIGASDEDPETGDWTSALH
jgi:hypothetical protein